MSATQPKVLQSSTAVNQRTNARSENMKSILSGSASPLKKDQQLATSPEAAPQAIAEENAVVEVAEKPAASSSKAASPVKRSVPTRSRSIIGDVDDNKPGSPVRTQSLRTFHTHGSLRTMSSMTTASRAAAAAQLSAAKPAAKPAEAAAPAAKSVAAPFVSKELSAAKEEIAALTVQLASANRAVSDADKRVAKETATRQKAELDNQKANQLLHATEADLKKEQLESKRLATELRKTEVLLESSRRMEASVRRQLDEQISKTNKLIAERIQSAAQHESQSSVANHDMAETKKALLDQSKKLEAKSREHSVSSQAAAQERNDRSKLEEALLAAKAEAKANEEALNAQIAQLEANLAAEKERSTIANKECDFALQSAKVSSDECAAMASSLRQMFEQLQTSDATVDVLKGKVAEQCATLLDAQLRADMTLKERTLALNKATDSVELYQADTLRMARQTSQLEQSMASTKQSHQAAEEKLAIESTKRASIERALSEAIEVDFAALQFEIAEKTAQIAALEEKVATLKEENLMYSQQCTAEHTRRIRAEESAAQMIKEAKQEIESLKAEVEMLQIIGQSEKQAYLALEQDYELRIKALSQ